MFSLEPAARGFGDRRSRPRPSTRPHTQAMARFAGGLVVIGALVAVLAVFGSSGVTVPDVVGLNPEDAAAQLRSEGFETKVRGPKSQKGWAGYAPLNGAVEYGADIVVRQSPAAGSAVDSGALVRLVSVAGPAARARIAKSDERSLPLFEIPSPDEMRRLYGIE